MDARVLAVVVFVLNSFDSSSSRFCSFEDGSGGGAGASFVS
jgi:hypothetical protein